MERRREERLVMDPVDLISAEFSIVKGHDKDRLWNLNVFNCSNYGLGLLVRKIDFELLQILKPGDLIADVKLYSEWGIIKVDATIKHITKIEHGPYKDQCILGLRSNEIVEICRPREEYRSGNLHES
jgi:hypothetical protein